ncbi:MAG: DUF1302 family protein [Thermodesulfobacteriota bacterium]
MAVSTTKVLLILGWLLFSLCPAMAGADDLDAILDGFADEESTEAGDDLDDALSGFGDDGEFGGSQPGPAAPALLPTWLKLSGGLTLASSYNFSHQRPDPGTTDQRGFSKLRTTADLDGDIKLGGGWLARLGAKAFYDAVYSLRDRQQYSNQVLDEYEDEWEITEAYVQGSVTDKLDVKLGRQIVVWGKSDNIRVTDILNPLDNREPGLVDIRDLRLPVAMTKVDYYLADWNLSALVSHELRFHKVPVFGNDFYQAPAPAPHEEDYSVAWDNQEFALAANGIFQGWDLSFYGAYLYDDQSHLEMTSRGPALTHSRIGMVGSAVNIAKGNWLLKAEAAYLDGLEYTIDVGKKNRFDALLGAEYQGISETSISLELVNRHIMAFDNRLEEAPVYERQDDFQYVLRISRDLYNDKMQLTALLSTYGVTGNGGAFQRFSAAYDWTDDITMTAGLITYQDGDKALFQDISDNDRLFLEVRYAF